MTITVKLFAVAKQIAGCDTLQVELAGDATVAQLRQALAAQVPRLAGIVEHLTFAVNTQYAKDTTIIPPGAEVACIPPVSGG